MGAQTKKQIFMEIIRFLLVGGLATLVDYVTFWLFDALLFPRILPTQIRAWETVALIFSTAIGFCVGLTVNWILSVRFVFREVRNEEEAKSKKSFAVFALIGLLGLALTEIGVVTLVALLPDITFLGKTAFFGTAWKKWIAKAVMTGVVLVFNYLGRKVFIFKS